MAADRTIEEVVLSGEKNIPRNEEKILVNGRGDIKKRERRERQREK